MQFYTYFHTRNDTNSVFYVGKGLGKRAHSTARNQHWHNIVAKHGHTVHIAMTHLSENDAFEHEKLLIQCFKDMGIPLCNQTDGGVGSGGYLHTSAVRAKIAASRKGVPHGPLPKSVRINISKSLLGNTRTLGHKLSEQHRAKISESLIGNSRTKGYFHTDESKANMSASRMGVLRGKYRTKNPQPLTTQEKPK